MSDFPPHDCSAVLLARQSLNLSGEPGLWRVARGVFWVSHEVGDRDVQVLALPGDLVGVEQLGVSVTTRSCTAVTHGVLTPVSVSDPSTAQTLIRAAYDQSRVQSANLLQLRTGPMPDRIKHLLLLLGDLAGEVADVVDFQLPTLRQMAELTDSTAESVCRVLTRLRGHEVLQTTSYGQTRLRLDALRSGPRSMLCAALPQGGRGTPMRT